MSTWTGDPLAEIADHEAAQSTITQLTETYLGAARGSLRGAARSRPPRRRAAGPGTVRRREPAARRTTGAAHGRAVPGRPRPEALEVHRTFRTPAAARSSASTRAHGSTSSCEQSWSRTPSSTPPRSPPDPRPRGGCGASTLADRHRRSAAHPPRAVHAPAATSPRARPVGRERETGRLAGHIEALARSGAGLGVARRRTGHRQDHAAGAREGPARDTTSGAHRASRRRSRAPAFWPWTQVLESVAASLDDDRLHGATAGAARPVAQLAPSIAAAHRAPAPITGDSAQALRFLLVRGRLDVPGPHRTGDPHRHHPGRHPVGRPSQPRAAVVPHADPRDRRPMLLVAAYRNLPADSTDALTPRWPRSRGRTWSTRSPCRASAGRGRRADGRIVTSPPTGPTDAAGPRGTRAARPGSPRAHRRQPVLRPPARPAVARSGHTDHARRTRHLCATGVRTRHRATHQRPERPGAGVPERRRGRRPRVRPPPRRGRRRDDARRTHSTASTRPGDTAWSRPRPRSAGRRGSSTHWSTRSCSRTCLRDEPHGCTPASPTSCKARQPPRRHALAEHLWAARDVVGAAAVPAQLAAAEAAAGFSPTRRPRPTCAGPLQLVRTSLDADPHTELSCC